MIRILFHPLVLLLLAVLAIAIWRWASRVNLRVQVTRPPTPREWAAISAFTQLVRWLLRLRF